MPGKRSLIFVIRSLRGEQRFGACLALLGVLLVGSHLASAQATTSVRGTVTDTTGSAIAGAAVVIANAQSQIERTTTTGSSGEYQFLLLSPGFYTLRITAPGFQGYEQKNLQLLVNTPATVNAQLQVGGAKEIVTVTSEEPVLNLVDASIGNSFEEKQVKQIPLEGRNVPDLLTLQAGVAYTGNRTDIDKDQDTRNGAVNGARSDQSNITLDGVDVNDQANGYAFTAVLPVTLDSVQEFRVTTTNYGADQGQGSGAQVALVTKSGTNQFHGSLYEYLRNTFTSANDYLIKRAEILDGQPNKPEKLNRNIFGVSVGGPVKKDRLFFFANYEGTREREEQSIVRAIPTPTLCQGNLRYVNVNGGITTLTPGDIQSLDPVGTGINPVMLNLKNHTGYLDRTFCTGQFITNDTSVGDNLNYSGFRFRAPVSLDNNAFIARLDYHINAQHSLFWRGALQNINNPQAPFLPGSAPEQTLADHSKGFVVGYTAVFSPTKVNSFHWGFTRQSVGIVGDTNEPWNTFIGLDQGLTYSRDLQVPVHNLSDDFSWTIGTHTLQFGTNVGIARNPRTSYLHSFNFGLGTSSWMSPTALADSASPLDPTNLRDASFPNGAPEVDLADKAGYDRPMIGLLGIVSDVVAQYNYDKSGNLLPQGAPLQRRYGLDWYEFYVQDSWRVKSNLTVTYGLRWSLFPPPWETNGYQISSTFSLGQQFNQNVQNMKAGKGYTSEGPITFIPGGPANNGPGFYHLSKTDFAPRVSFAYSPRPSSSWLRKVFGDNDKTVIRGGFSEVYDRAGFAILNTLDQNAPGGFSTTLQNTCCQPGIDDAADVPRISNVNVVPTANRHGSVFLTPAPSGKFPQVPTLNAQANLWAFDDTLKTPHSYAVDFSIGRELPNRFSLQVSYVGRFGENLLTQRDLNQPLDIVDTKSGTDYYAAATALSKVARANPNQFTSAAAYQAFLSSVTDSTIGSTAVYWHDMLPALTGGATGYKSFSGATIAPGNAGLIQAVYDLYYNPGLSYVGNEIVGLADIDLYGGLSNNLGQTLYFNGPTGFNGGAGKFLNDQAISMFSWSSVGNSNFNALQASLRKQYSNGVQFDFNYTYSKSLDTTSTSSRVGFALVGYQNIGLLGSRLENAFQPNAIRAPSDFDATHQFNADFIAELPFGRGKRLAGNAGPGLDALVGGWQLQGLARWTSAYPLSVDVGQNWPTDWQYTGLAQMITKPKTGVFRQPDGSVSLFAEPAAAQQDFAIPFPGGSGSRNVLRGDGYAGLDLGLSKRWKVPTEAQSLQFRWEVFNVLNQVHFNGQGVGSATTSLLQPPSAFGTYSGLLTQPRVMQFALRYEF